MRIKRSCSLMRYWTHKCFFKADTKRNRWFRSMEFWSEQIPVWDLMWEYQLWLIHPYHKIRRPLSRVEVWRWIFVRNAGNAVKYFVSPYSPQLPHFLQKITAFTAFLTKIYPKTSTRVLLFWTQFICCISRVEVWQKNNARLAVNSGEKTFFTAKRPHLLALNAVNFCDS